MVVLDQLEGDGRVRTVGVHKRVRPVGLDGLVGVVVPDGSVGMVGLAEPVRLVEWLEWAMQFFDVVVTGRGNFPVLELALGLDT